MIVASPGPIDEAYGRVRFACTGPDAQLGAYAWQNPRLHAFLRSQAGATTLADDLVRRANTALHSGSTRALLLLQHEIAQALLTRSLA